MRMIASAQELYFDDHGEYFTSAVMPRTIPNYMPEVPVDPKTVVPYGWVDNTPDPQSFCAYAWMEKREPCRYTRYYIASHKGNLEVCDVTNWTLECP